MIRPGFPWFGASALAVALLISSCGDARLAGTSSGVDNPQLTVGFVDEDGVAMHVTGDLEVFARDQNPAIDPRPLWTIQVRNSSLANLTGDDFRRIRGTSALRATPPLLKPVSGRPQSMPVTLASAPSASADTGVTAFNLLLRTEDRTGALMMELSYDPAMGKFSRAGGPVSRVEARPAPLVRYEARLARKDDGEVGRVFVPGTPFVATLVDSAFAFGNLPPGVFPLRTLTAKGYVYPFEDSLATGAKGVLHRTLPEPVEKLDRKGTDSLPGFAAVISGPGSAVLNERYFLDGDVLGIDAANPRLSLLWRQIRPSKTPDPPGPKGPEAPPGDSAGPLTAQITSPLGLHTEVVFMSEGVHHFTLSATVGLHTVADTIEVNVKRPPPPPKQVVLKPRPGDTLRLGAEAEIAWDFPGGGDSAFVELSTDAGRNWSLLPETAGVPGNAGSVYWTPVADLAASDSCLVRVSSRKDPLLRAVMEGYFSLLP